MKYLHFLTIEGHQVLRIIMFFLVQTAAGKLGLRVPPNNSSNCSGKNPSSSSKRGDLILPQSG
jgi:hypothetical protein